MRFDPDQAHRNEPPQRPKARLISWRPLHKNTLRGFAAVRFPSAIEVFKIGIHRAGERTRASPPGEPWLDASGAAIRDDRGKIKYTALIAFVSHGVRSRWGRAVIDALLEVYPHALDAEGPATTPQDGREPTYADDEWGPPL
jgi:hypothetical protein